MNFTDFSRLPEILLDDSKRTEYVELLSENFILMYNIQEIRKEVKEKIKLLNDYKYIVGENIPMSASKYELSRNVTSNLKSDMVGNYVEKIIDLGEKVESTVKAITNIANKLTSNEAEYFVLAFFKHMSEEKIAEQLNVCRMTLQHIKNSALLKVYFEMLKG